MSKEQADLRRVILDSELERGVWEPGRYYIQTPRFDYVATLEAVTAMSFVVSDVSVVFESGPYPDLLKGQIKDAQFLAAKAVLDRAGTHMFKLPEL